MAIIRSISLNKELNEQIQEYCQAKGMKVSSIISVLLIKLLEEQDGARRSTDLFEQKN